MRGIVESTLVGVILAVVGGIVLGAIVFNFIGTAKPAVDLAACKADVQLASLSKQFTSITRCYTKNAGSLPYSGNLQTYEDELSAGLAELLKECKYQFGETEHSPWTGDVFSNQRVCFACSTFRIPGTSTQSTFGSELKTSHLVNWLWNHRLKSTASSYAEYLRPSFLNLDANQVAAGLQKLTYGVDYAVVSYTQAGNRLQQVTNTQIDTQGSEDLKEPRAIFILPVHDLSNNCDITYVRYP